MLPRRPLAALSFVTLAAATAGETHAALVEVVYAGSVRDISGTPSGVFAGAQFGDTTRLILLIDTLSTDGTPGDPTVGSFVTMSWIFEVGEKRVLGSGGNLFVWNNHESAPGILRDAVAFDGGAGAIDIFSELFTPPSTTPSSALLSDQIPLALDLSRFVDSMGARGNGWEIESIISDFSVTTVPGPGVGGVALCALGLVRGRRRR